jgi:prepilin-type processing-associated H-X9-DG protein
MRSPEHSPPHNSRRAAPILFAGGHVVSAHRDSRVDPVASCGRRRRRIFPTGLSTLVQQLLSPIAQSEGATEADA